MGVAEDFPNIARYVDACDEMEVIHQFIHCSGYTLCTWNEEQGVYVEVKDDHQDILFKYYDIDNEKFEEEQKHIMSRLVDVLAKEMVGQLVNDVREEEGTT